MQVSRGLLPSSPASLSAGRVCAGVPRVRQGATQQPGMMGPQEEEEEEEEEEERWLQEGHKGKCVEVDAPGSVLKGDQSGDRSHTHTHALWKAADVGCGLVVWSLSAEHELNRFPHVFFLPPQLTFEAKTF